MTGMPAELLTSISIDLIRDMLGSVPDTVLVCGVSVRTTSAAAGKGTRPYWACPACSRRVLLLYISPMGIPACRTCHGVAYGRRREPGSVLGRLAAELGRASA